MYVNPCELATAIDDSYRRHRQCGGTVSIDRCEVQPVLQLRPSRGDGWMGQDTKRASNLVARVREDGEVEIVLLLHTQRTVWPLRAQRNGGRCHAVQEPGSGSNGRSLEQGCSMGTRLRDRRPLRERRLIAQDADPESLAVMILAALEGGLLLVEDAEKYFSS